MPSSERRLLYPRAFFPLRGVGCWLFLEAVEEPEAGFDFALFRAEDTVFARTAVCRREFALAPDADRNISPGLVTRRLHRFPKA